MMQFLKKNSKVVIPVIVILAAVIAYLAFRGSNQAQTTYQTETVVRGQLVATVGATGTVRARQSATLVWQTGGTVEAVNASVGDIVPADAVLASLVPATVSQNIILAQADLVSAQKALDDLKTSDTARAQAAIALRNAQKVYDDAKSYRDSLDDGIVVRLFGHSRKIEADEETIAKADERLALATAQLADAQRAYDRVKDGPNSEDLAAAQARVDAAQATINLARLVAPFGGTVTEAYPLAGDVVTAGTQGFRLDDLARLLVDVEISEVDVNKVAVGQKTMLTFDAILGSEYHGAVVEVSQAGTVSSGVVNFIVTVELSDADAQVKPGMTAAVTITVQELNDVVLIPNRAVRLVDGKRVVYLLQNGQPVKVEVQLGSSSDTMSVLASGDVKEGDSIILNPPAVFQGGGGPPFMQ
jgi:HlyD family secretion protein